MKGNITVAVIVLVLAAEYPLGCWLYPFRRCRWCKATGRRHSSSGKTFRLCWWCKGTARRLRWGRRFYNYFAQQRREGSR